MRYVLQVCQSDCHHILVVDDDQISCRVAVAMLNHLGYQAQYVLNGEEAQNIMLCSSFDLVLLDWIMPSIDGPAAVNLIRNGAAGAHHAEVPIIAVTADVIRYPRSVCLRSGVNGYLSKPITLETLSVLLKEIL